MNKLDWIQLDTIAAKINLDPLVKPAVIVGKTHGFLWIKQKTMLFSFGDNQYGQLGTSGPTLDSLKTLYPVSCPIIPIEICVLDTFTAIITQEGDLFVTGLFMVKVLYSNKRKLKDTGIELNPKKSGNQWLDMITYC
jgi:alpha-tubulin suppressor-like RCC1 family protein